MVQFIIRRGSLQRNITAAVIVAGLAQYAVAENWPQWRGPGGNSVSTESDLPVQWSETQGLRWKTPLPEWGTSTPAVWENAAFVTSEEEGRLWLLRIDVRNGRPEWQHQVGEGAARRKIDTDGKRSAKFHDLHNLASPSPVTDGKTVVVHFGNGDLAAYDFDGKQLWKRNLAEDYGPYTIWWGHANSPLLYRDKVISVCMQDSMEGDWDELSPSYLVAHDLATGEEIWKTMRMTGADAEQCDAYTTPLFTRAGGRPQLLLMGGNQLDAYSPDSGRQLWHLPGLVGGRTITGPTVAGEYAYATVGMRGALHAVSLTGEGQLADEAVVWKHSESTPDSCCPVVSNGLLFMVTDNGIATCLDAGSGEVKWKQRLSGGNFKASPLAADGRIYFLSQNGTCSVVKADSEFELLAENKLADEFLASPAVSNGRILLRGRTALYAIGR